MIVFVFEKLTTVKSVPTFVSKLRFSLKPNAGETIFSPVLSGFPFNVSSLFTDCDRDDDSMKRGLLSFKSNT
ncbi:unnamed protein product [Schistosoma mattheei]|uniref:Uncharacterized protein n=1 Tax=Schistosoma mattheei TaxID=31246 RepID=A0A183PC02_9TREM|nr:unnamed protein product [Schistosoma mattheei]